MNIAQHQKNMNIGDSRGKWKPQTCFQDENTRRISESLTTIILNILSTTNFRNVDRQTQEREKCK
jgi:hypothetical protein